VLSTGSQLASFEGTSYWLGLCPDFPRTETCWFHPLDAQKNLEPLGADPLRFPPADGTVVIDPGHGGQNTGTQSVVDRTFEKEWTLDWALRLAPLLASNGWRVVLTRTKRRGRVAGGPGVGSRRGEGGPVREPALQFRLPQCRTGRRGDFLPDARRAAFHVDA